MSSENFVKESKETINILEEKLREFLAPTPILTIVKLIQKNDEMVTFQSGETKIGYDRSNLEPLTYIDVKGSNKYLIYFLTDIYHTVPILIYITEDADLKEIVKIIERFK